MDQDRILYRGEAFTLTGSRLIQDDSHWAEVEKDGRIMTRVSLRSSGADDVRKVAAQFGGGGHRNAAGATVDLPPEKTLAVIQPYIRHVWN